MTPGARVQSAIEILDRVISAALEQGPPADRILAEWFRSHRFAGSKDRRAIRDLVFGAIRACGPVPQTGRAAMLRLAQVKPAIAPLFDGSQYGPAPMEEGELVAGGGVAPQWLERELAASEIVGPEALALLDRAPLDLRVNALKASRESLSLPIEAEHLPTANGLRVPVGSPVEQWQVYREGKVEVQDCGSQLACEAVAARPGETVIDLCAGAGGKTLALAAAMHNEGVLIAADSDRGRLSRLGPRAHRAGAEIAQPLLLNPGRELNALSDWLGRADTVLVDAPCSGTGTWRRNPEARWRIDAAMLERLVQLQERLLGIAAQLVRPGGRLVYVTCSLLDAEGAGQAERFLAANPAFSADPLDPGTGSARGPGMRLSPFHHDTDGFFIARLGKAC